MYTFRGSKTNTKTNTNKKGYGRGINLSEQCIYLQKSKHLVVYNGQICYEIIWADCTINDNYSETCIL